MREAYFNSRISHCLNFVRNFEYLYKLWFDEQTSTAWRTIIYATNCIGEDFEKTWHCGTRFPAIFIPEGSTNLKICNCFYVNGNPNSFFNFEPSDKEKGASQRVDKVQQFLSDQHPSKDAFTSGSWHKMEYMQTVIPGQSHARYSVSINGTQVFTQARFQILVRYRVLD